MESTQRFNHIAMTVPGAQLDEAGCAEILEFYRDVFGDSEMHRLMKYLAGEQKIPLNKWWRFLRRAPEVWLISELDLARLPMQSKNVLPGQGGELAIGGREQGDERLCADGRWSRCGPG